MKFSCVAFQMPLCQSIGDPPSYGSIINGLNAGCHNDLPLDYTATLVETVHDLKAGNPKMPPNAKYILRIDVTRIERQGSLSNWDIGGKACAKHVLMKFYHT